MDEYKQQGRGGKGVKGLTRREEDVVKTMFTCSTHDHIMFFTTMGNHALWLALLSYLLARGVMQTMLFWRAKVEGLRTKD